MTSYVIKDASDILTPYRISGDMFGGNGLNVYHDLENPNSSLVKNIERMGVTSLRYPGGSVTEKWFDMADPEATRGSNDGSFSRIVGLSDFLRTAKTLGAHVNFVLPTVDGFAISAGEAILNGSYGSREVKSGYSDEVKNFIWTLMDKAEDSGVYLKSIEIGNEFWGSGRMTSSEYGRLAGTMAVAIEEAYLSRGIAVKDQPKIIVQTISSAGFFSPNSDRVIFVESVEDGDTGKIHYKYHMESCDGLVASVIPGQGDARMQNRDLVSQFNLIPGAADAVDAVSDHLYGKKGLEGVDEGQNSGFKELNRFVEYLGRTERLPAVEFHVTEWNAKADDGNKNYDNNKGSEGASLMVEIFYELASNGISAAQVWPLEGKSLNTALSFGDETAATPPSLTMFGEMFRLMSNSLIGLKASLDFSVEGEVDIHGFSNGSRDVLFVSERSGRDSTVDLQLGAVLQDEKYLIIETRLTDGAVDGADSSANPVVTVHDGYVTEGDSLSVNLEAKSNSRIEITYITDGDDRISGREGADHFYGEAGNDTLTGYEGDDVILGGPGLDVIHGGSGDDYLDGGAEADIIYGRSGDDYLIGDAGADRIFGGAGDDFVNAGTGNDVVDGGVGEDFLIGGSGSDLISGNSDDDFLVGEDGQDELYGNSGDDHLAGGNGSDILFGGGGFDTLSGDAGDDILSGGDNWDVFEFRGNFGNDTITDFDTENQFEVMDVTGWEGIASFTSLISTRASQVDFDSGVSTVISDTFGNSITLLGVAIDQLDSNDFWF